MAKIVKQYLHTLISFNIHIVIFYITITTLLLLKLEHFVKEPNKESIYIVIGNFFLILGAYTFNKITDVIEDVANNNTTDKSKLKLATIYLLSFFFSFVAYLLPQDNFILIPYASMLLFSIIYSYPPKYRLKQYFIIKNIVPASCWTIALATFMYTAIGTIDFLKVVLLCIPFFLSCVLIEILWDMPDIQGDRLAGTKTLPSVIGFSKTKYFIAALMVFVFFLSSIAGKIVSLTCLLFLIFVTEKTEKIFYNYLLVVMSIILLLAQLVF
jgi:4-hydroxybenzoate polyprenyltransferase